MTPAEAAFSSCRRYRYALWRRWPALFDDIYKYAMVIGLNPSTADETTDDPTIRRCVAFAKAWDFNALCMVNLFAFRATDPADMRREPEPIGPENDRYLLDLSRDAGIVVAAWGGNGPYRGRDREVRRLIPNLHYLKLTKHGHPQHPLYLPNGLTPIRWEHP